MLAGVFLVNKYFEYADHFAHGEGPSHSTFLAIYFTLTGLHGLHILGGMVVMAVLPRAGREAVEDEARAVHEPHRVHGAVLALRRPGVDLPVPGAVFAVEAAVAV